MTLKKETRDKLLNISTATLFTAMFKRGLRNQSLQGVHIAQVQVRYALAF